MFDGKMHFPVCPQCKARWNMNHDSIRTTHHRCSDNCGMVEYGVGNGVYKKVGDYTVYWEDIGTFIQHSSGTCVRLFDKQLSYDIEIATIEKYMILI